MKATDLGASFLMIEKGVVGGTCVNVGCVPSKRLLAAGDIYYYGDHHYDGITLDQGSLQLDSVIKEKDDIVADQRERKYTNVIRDLPGATYLEGSAKFLSMSELNVNGSRIRGKNFLIATGSSPRILPIKGVQEVGYLTNVEALSPRRWPESLVILGGRALALEFAQMYSHFGTEVTVLQRSEQIIPEEGPELSEALED